MTALSAAPVEIMSRLNRQLRTKALEAFVRKRPKPFAEAVVHLIPGERLIVTEAADSCSRTCSRACRCEESARKNRRIVVAWKSVFFDSCKISTAGCR